MNAFQGGFVCLDDYNSDLNFVIESDGVTGSSLHRSGFEYIWAGARATHGVSRGKVCFEVHVQKKLEVEMPETETCSHVMRVGWSVDASPFAVGEAPLSYGYGGTGKASCNNKFSNYGGPYSTDDVITSYIDLDAVPKTIFFARNGNYLGVAFRLGPEADGKVFYPHVSVKNMSFVANFGGFNPYFPPAEGFCLIQHMPPHMLSFPPASPKDRRECEVLMMVGLPSCGKTTWLGNYVKDHPEKKYNVLGTNDILVKMKVMGLNRKRNYEGRWDALIKQASGILNELLKIAQRKIRNYILDQTNVYPNARRRKMNNFREYHRVAVVLVNENSVLMQRNEKVVREDGKVVPESAFMEMKANFTLPVRGEIFDEVWYIEEDETRSRSLVKEFNEEGRNWKAGEKKRSIDDVEIKQEPPSADFKKSRHHDSTSSNQPKNKYGGFRIDGPRPQYFNERRAVPCEESQPCHAVKQESFHLQPNQNPYPQRQHHYNPQLQEREQQNRGSNYQEPESNYNYRQEIGRHSQERFNQRQSEKTYNQSLHFQGDRSQRRAFQGHPRNHNQQHYQEGQGESAGGNSGNNYNQPGYHESSWSEERARQGRQGNHNPGNQQTEQGEGRFSRGDQGQSYSQPAYPQDDQSRNYARQGDNRSSTQLAYGAAFPGYHAGYQNQDEDYNKRNQRESDGHSFSRNFPATNEPPQRYHHDGNAQGWKSPQDGFNQTEKYWGGPQGWNVGHSSQGYNRPQRNLPQASSQKNWNRNQPSYH